MTAEANSLKTTGTAQVNCDAQKNQTTETFIKRGLRNRQKPARAVNITQNIAATLFYFTKKFKIIELYKE